MSTDRRVPCRDLDEYVRELVIRLATSEPAAFRELRATVGVRRASIGLDEEVVEVVFRGEVLHVGSLPRKEAERGPPDGTGATDRGCVADLLDGYTEVAAAVLDGRLTVRGGLDDVLAMLGAIEIILDVSARSPALQALAEELRTDPCRPPFPPRLPADVGRATHWHPGTVSDEEAALLSRLDLLPGAPEPSS